jgi:hypothetical protein
VVSRARLLANRLGLFLGAAALCLALGVFAVWQAGLVAGFRSAAPEFHTRPFELRRGDYLVEIHHEPLRAAARARPEGSIVLHVFSRTNTILRRTVSYRTDPTDDRVALGVLSLSSNTPCAANLRVTGPLADTEKTLAFQRNVFPGGPLRYLALAGGVFVAAAALFLATGKGTSPVEAVRKLFVD